MQRKSIKIFSIFFLFTLVFIIALSCGGTGDKDKILTELSKYFDEIQTQNKDDLAEGADTTGITVPLEKAKNISELIEDGKISVKTVSDNSAPMFTSIINNAVLPSNIGRQNFFAWTNPDNKYNLFYLTIEIPITESGKSTNEKLRIVTKSVNFTPNDELWDKFKNKADKGKDIAAQIYGIAENSSGDITEVVTYKDKTSFKILDEKLEGSIYFWRVSNFTDFNSTTINNAKGSIMVMDSNGNNIPVSFYGFGSPDYDHDGKAEYADFCAGCHAVSHDGKKYAIVEHLGTDMSRHQSIHFGDISVSTTAPYRVPKDTSVYPPAGSPPDKKACFVDFNPKNNDWVVFAVKGDIYVKKVSDTTDIGTALPSSVNTQKAETMPTWNPNGSIAFVRCEQLTNNEGFTIKGPANIYVYTPTNPANIAAGGTVTKLTITDIYNNPDSDANNNNDMNYYPSFSPDGKWIAYTHHNMGTNGDSNYADPKQGAKAGINVYIVSVSGGSRYSVAPSGWIEFINSWSTWGKKGEWFDDNGVKSDIDIKETWIAFSSSYPLYPNINPNNDDMNIYIVRITFSGGTPSFSPPIPLPNANNPKTGEHLPMWTVK
ncbi:MAG: PD40 domain-containing protein [Candidatus Firestonebacteria bacterium]|nr:PD40 domain-containing protein [Candidatus Firestonebacteria bacterium]